MTKYQLDQLGWMSFILSVIYFATTTNYNFINIKKG